MLCQSYHYISHLASNAFMSVNSSAYSNSEPKGIPNAILEIFIPKGFKSLLRYMLVASPSTEGFRANMTSLMSSL